MNPRPFLSPPWSASGDGEASALKSVFKSVSRKEARLNAELGFWERNGHRPRTWDKGAHQKPKTLNRKP